MNPYSLTLMVCGFWTIHNAVSIASITIRYPESTSREERVKGLTIATVAFVLGVGMFFAAIFFWED